jgi:hypothetical protein
MYRKVKMKIMSCDFVSFDVYSMLLLLFLSCYIPHVCFDPQKNVMIHINLIKVSLLVKDNCWEINLVRRRHMRLSG